MPCALRTPEGNAPQARNRHGDLAGARCRLDGVYQ